MKHKCTKVESGVYKYRGYTLYNRGYHAPDKCVWWEALDDTMHSDFREISKKLLIEEIDRELE